MCTARSLNAVNARSFVYADAKVQAQHSFSRTPEPCRAVIGEARNRGSGDSNR
jgi:hypothetical protein